MLQYMLDTNICIYVIKNYPPKLRAFQSTRRATLHIERYARGAALRAEKSARRSENLQAIGQFCARLEVLAFPAKAAAHFGQIRADVERLGKPVGPLDMLIGAHARAEGLIVVTNNAREFLRLPGIRVENWVDEGGSPA